jgi:serine protease inhibitor
MWEQVGREGVLMNRLLRTALSSWLAAACFCAGGPSFSQGSSSPQSTSTDFSLKLFGEQAKGKTKNVVVSPFSAYVALSMVLNGAAGKTREEIAGVLGVSADAVDGVNARIAKAMKSLSGTGTVQLDIANAVYSDKSTPFRKDFIEACERNYGAEAQSIDFSGPSVLKLINAWCNEKTHGKIAEILNNLTGDEKMVLLNAIYFKGSWQEKFPASSTKDDIFVTLDGSKSPVKMMRHMRDTMYYKGADFSSVALPYAGGKQRMYIFLPDPGVKLAAFEGEFTKKNWSRWMGSYTNAHAFLSLPKFKIEYSTELGSTLKTMGMADAFEQRADFSKMVSPPAKAWISRVLQKTYMDVNEEGTEAAAATAVFMGEKSMIVREEFIPFRVDRPFVLALVDQPTNEILFLGAIVKP